MEFKHAQTDIIQMLSTLNEQLGVARNNYLRKKFEFEHTEAKMIKTIAGKSVAERTLNAKASEEWLALALEFSRAESVYDFYKDKVKVLNMEYQSQYLETKLSEGLGKK